MEAIKFNNVSEMYQIKFVNNGKVTREDFWALKEVNFSVEHGETVGIIGENGAGKSTILKIIAGMLKPDQGDVVVSGRVSGLLELGAGFQHELTGEENIHLSAGLFGLTHEQIKERYEEIVTFTDIGKFIHAPVKYYSQGMFVRLAFAIAIHIDPDILLIDDTLAVGDGNFQRRCVKKILELKEQGKTIIFVTHDMNMLRRLCKRVIFLKENRIIRDDVVDKVIPLYTQITGQRQGVGILEKNPLQAVFNNGRLFLNWQGKILTPDSGASISFSISDKWYNSLQADWEVKQEGQNVLFATGKFYQLDLIQVWRLEIANDYAIKWDIQLESDGPVDIEEGYVNIMLIDEYTDWFSAVEKGNFPEIDYKDQGWYSLLNANILARCIGINCKDTQDGRIPSIIFKQSDLLHLSSGQILNTDYLSNCRVLQYKIPRLQNYSSVQVNRFAYFSGEVILNIPDTDDYLKNIEDKFVLSGDKIKLIFSDGHCILSYNGVNLTKANHVHISSYINGRWYSSNLARWEVEKQGKNNIIATGVWPDLPLIYIWEIELNGDNSFVYKVTMQVNDSLDIEQQYFNIEGCKDYTHWFNKYASGRFPDTFLETEMDMAQRCIPDGEVGFISRDSLLPALCVKFSNEFNNFTKIKNSNFYSKVRILRIEKVEPEENIRFLPGRYPCFNLEIRLDKDKKPYPADFNMLQRKKLKLVFDNGSGRIFWEGMELTKRLGLYTSLRSQGHWYDSASSAIWEIHKESNIIRTIGMWKNLPVKQLWEIRLAEGWVIEFNVRMEVADEIEVDRMQTNLMLSETYSQWITDKTKGVFPLFKAEIDDDWDSVCPVINNIEHVGVVENTRGEYLLPSIIFYSQKPNSGWNFNIINSDLYHRGRVLQFLNKNKMVFPLGEYHFFSGRINIKV